MSIIGNPIMAGASGPAASIFVTGLSETDTVTATNGSKTLTGKWTQKPNPASVVPDGYTQLEYIESTGTQYINTLLSLPHGWQIKGKLLLTSVTTDSRAVFGAQAQNGSVWARNQFQPSWGSNNWFIGIGGYQYGGSPQANVEYEFDVCNIVGETSYIKINGENVALTTGQTDTGVRSDLSCYLFNSHNYDGTNFFGQFRMIGKWEVYNENHNLVGNYVPAKRNYDGEIAVYDLVTQDFLPNAGTGTFIAGAEIPQTIDGFLIKPIRDLGTWTVTASDGTDTYTQDVLVDVITEYEIEITKKLYLYRDGDEFEDVTGGWNALASGSSGSLTKNASSFTLAYYSGMNAYDAITKNTVDISDYSKLYIDWIFNPAKGGNARIGVSSSAPSGDAGLSKYSIISAAYTGVTELDVSDVSGQYYAVVTVYDESVTVNKIWLE